MEPKKTHPHPMKAIATGNGEARTGYDTKRNGAVKVHALAAPPFGNEIGWVFRQSYTG